MGKKALAKGMVRTNFPTPILVAEKKSYRKEVDHTPAPPLLTPSPQQAHTLAHSSHYLPPKYQMVPPLRAQNVVFNTSPLVRISF